MKCIMWSTTYITNTTEFIKKVLSVYTHSMATISLSLSVQVAKSTFFMKSPVCTMCSMIAISSMADYKILNKQGMLAAINIQRIIPKNRFSL